MYASLVVASLERGTHGMRGPPVLLDHRIEFDLLCHMYQGMQALLSPLRWVFWRNRWLCNLWVRFVPVLSIYGVVVADFLYVHDEAFPCGVVVPLAGVVGTREAVVRRSLE